jgi:hypothetical protein
MLGIERKIAATAALYWPGGEWRRYGRRSLRLQPSAISHPALKGEVGERSSPGGVSLLG